jgi:hypothetical protein
MVSAAAFSRTMANGTEKEKYLLLIARKLAGCCHYYWLLTPFAV